MAAAVYTEVVLCRVPVNRRTALHGRIDVGHGHEHLDLVARHRLGDGKLVKVAGIIVVDGSPEKPPQVADLAAVHRRRSLNPAKLRQCLGGEVGEQSPFEHHPSGDRLQDSAVLVAGCVH